MSIDNQVQRGAITVDHLSKSFGGVLAVNDVSLSVPAGSFFGIIGPNGAGKSTLLKALYGLVRISQGDVLIDGVSIGTNFKAESMVKRGIGYVPSLRMCSRLSRFERTSRSAPMQ